MRMGDIQPDGVYRAEVAYGHRVKVRVLATRLEYDKGYGPARRRRRTDGVRVALEEAVVSSIETERRDAGDELVIPSRQVLGEWTQEDQDALEAAVVETARKRRVEDLLGRAGYGPARRQFTYVDDEERDAQLKEGGFLWRGEWLMVRGELCEYLLELLADAEGVDRAELTAEGASADA